MCLFHFEAERLQLITGTLMIPWWGWSLELIKRRSWPRLPQHWTPFLELFLSDPLMPGTSQDWFCCLSRWLWVWTGSTWDLVSNIHSPFGSLWPLNPCMRSRRCLEEPQNLYFWGCHRTPWLVPVSGGQPGVQTTPRLRPVWYFFHGIMPPEWSWHVDSE